MLWLPAVVGMVVLAVFSVLGWGWLGRRTLRMPAGQWPITAATGIAVLVVIGGVANLARVAYPWFLGTVFLAGLLLFGVSVRGDFGRAAIRDRVGQIWSWRAPVYLLIGGIFLFTAATQARPEAFNLHDDYQKYFAHVVRMVQTGTVFGSPANAIGSQTLGGQAFLHGFVVAFFPLPFINSVDGVFAFLICLAAASTFNSGHRRLLAVTIICVSAVVIINPQYVNVSSLYSGSALMMAAMAISADPRELKSASAPNPLALGLLYAALAALKPTFGLFGALHLLAVAISIFLGGDRRGSLRWGLLAGVSWALFLSPWILVSGPYYLSAAGYKPPIGAVSAPTELELLRLFSPTGLGYGASILHYTSLIAVIGWCGFLTWKAGANAADERMRFSARMTAGAAFACAGAYLVQTFTAPYNAGLHHAVRYFTPFVIAAVPATVGLTGLHLLAVEPPKEPKKVKRNVADTKRTIRPVWVATIAAIPLIAFLPSLVDRWEKAANSGSAIAFEFAHDPIYRQYSRELFDGTARGSVTYLQNLIPPGEPVFAISNFGFLLDFIRNRVIDFNDIAPAAPWPWLPDARYVLWDYGGFATKTPEYYKVEAKEPGALVRMTALRNVEFYEKLLALCKKNEVLFDNGKTLVVRLNEPVDRVRW